MHRVTILRKDDEDVAFAELERQAADVNVGCVTVVGMPRGIWRDAFLELEVVQSLDLANGLHVQQEVVAAVRERCARVRSRSSIEVPLVKLW